MTRSLPAVTFMNMLFPNHRILCHRPTRAFAMMTMAVLLGIVTSTGRAGALKTGDSLPDLAGFALEGKIPEYKGRVVLLDFWASWCAPCKQSFPVLKEMHEKFGPRGFLVLAVSVDEQASTMQAFLKKQQPVFPVLRDPKGRLAESAGLDKMPTSLLISADGKVVAIHSGFEGEPTRKLYLSEIEAALKSAGK